VNNYFIQFIKIFNKEKPKMLKKRKYREIEEHKADVHDIGVTWHHCDQPKCEYKAKQKSTLKQHKADVHDIGVTWHHCDQPKCEYKAKQNSTLKRHKAFIHDIGVTWHHCDQPNCQFKTKQKGNLKIHKAHVHDIGVTWHHCDQPKCQFKAKRKSSLKKHKADVHDIGVTWHHCDVSECEYKTKQKSTLKIHKAFIHDIGVTWHHCDQPKCQFKTKQNSDLKEHKSGVHDIGDKECEICYSKVYSLTPFRDNNGNHRICRKCFRNETGYETRIEKQMVEYLKSIEEIKHYIVLEDKILRGKQCNTKRRPDLLLSSSEDFHIVIECDEKQHCGNSYSCETGRMNEIIDELSGRVIFIRWNPDGYSCKHNKDKKKLKKDERLNLLKDLILYLCNKTEWKDEETIFCYYMFYNVDNEMISKTINNKLVFDKHDF
jgi:hypothetical protein